MPTLQSALINGVGFAPLAVAAFDALESWSSVIGDRLGPHLKHVLPYLEAYLKPGDEGNEGDDASSSKSESPPSAAPSSPRSAAGAVGSTDFSARAVRILGKLGNQLNYQMLERASDASDKPSWIAWNTTKILEYNVDFFAKKGCVRKFCS